MVDFAEKTVSLRLTLVDLKFRNKVGTHFFLQREARKSSSGGTSGSIVANWVRAIFVEILVITGACRS